MGEAVDFERALIGAVCLDTAAVVVEAVKAGVSAEWFASGKWRLAWSSAVGLWRRDSTSAFDENLMLAEAKRLVSAHPKEWDGEELSLRDLSDAVDACPVADCAGGYILQLKGQLIERQMRKIIGETFKVSAKFDPETACGELVQKLLELLSRTMVAKTASFSDLVDASLNNMREAHRIRMVEHRLDYVPGLPCPWWAMTEMLNGMVPGFHIIGARTSVGKTSFALQLVRFFAETGLEVGFDSLDMNTRSFVDRFISECSRVSLFKANFGYTSNEEISSIEAAAEKVRSWQVTILVEYDVDRLLNWCRVRKSAKKLDVLFVDFVQLLSYRGADRATDTGRMTRVSKTLKRIVNELDIPVIGLSQLNRECERDGGREPCKADLRESGALEQDATTVMLLYHDKETLAMFQEGAAAGVGVVNSLANGNKYLAQRITPTFLKLDKNQNGGLGRLPFVVFSNYFTWMLGDYEAQPRKTTVGAGATKKEVLDWSPQFHRVHADWRHNPFEADLKRYGVLLPESAPRPPKDADGVRPSPAPVISAAPAPVVQTTMDSIMDPQPDGDQLADVADDDDYYDPSEDPVDL